MKFFSLTGSSLAKKETLTQKSGYMRLPVRLGS